MPDTCVFCGGTPTTREHVFSTSWVEELMPDVVSWTSDLFRRDGEGPELRRSWTKPKTPKSRVGSPEVRCACAPCNNEWMQALDTRAREVLTPLALGQTGTVSAEGVELLATWAAKIAIVLDSMFGGVEVIDRETKARFRDALLPPETWTVWVATMNPSMKRTRVTPMTLNDAADRPMAYFASFSVLHLVLQVFCPLVGDAVFRRSPGLERHVARLWPQSGPLRWPPPEEAWLRSEDAFTALAEGVMAGAVS